MDSTIDYYQEHAADYVAKTRNADMAAVYAPFLRHLPPGARILDAGSGSGRDTLEFLKLGYDCDAFDASAELCARSSAATGRKTRNLRFEEFKDPETYDGIWACASLLHVKNSDLPDAFHRLISSLKPGGVLYTCFKMGRGEVEEQDGRHFTNLTDHGLRALLRAENLAVADIWMTGDTIGRGTQWLNAVATKARASTGDPKRAQFG